MAYKLKDVAKPTTFIEVPLLEKEFGIKMILASETFQHTGSFKFRAAYEVASSVPNTELIAASSGNFGQALAYACSLLDKSCTIVMPDNSSNVKIEAVKRYGGTVDLIDTTKKTRAMRVGELSRENRRAYVTSAYDNEHVINGNASLGRELAAVYPSFNHVVASIGGGGLTSGIIKGIKDCGKKMRVVAAEPLLANDAAQCMNQGCIVSNSSEPQTIADGARTLSLGLKNWEILKDGGLTGVIEVPEEYISEAVRILFEKANLKAEPTGALSVGAILACPEYFMDKRTCFVISGGNVDPELYAKILRREI